MDNESMALRIAAKAVVAEADAGEKLASEVRGIVGTLNMMRGIMTPDQQATIDMAITHLNGALSRYEAECHER